MKTLEKDIMLICKGWYNKEKYSNILEALNAYYHREYGCEDITMDKEFAISLFLKPTFIEFGNMIYLFEPTCTENVCISSEQTFVTIFYERLISGINRIICKNKIDLSDYQEIFDAAKTCNYEDSTIGII